MENKNKYLFLIVGIVIGVVITLSVAFLFSNDADEVGIVVAETEHGHEAEKTKIGIDDAHENEEEIVKLSNEEIKKHGIIIEKIGSINLEQHSDFTGEIVPIPEKLAHIVPRFGGIVKVVFKKIGDNIKKDDVIAVIESNESLVTYEMKSSINGTVIELHMTAGEMIGDDKHVVTIADLSSVWAELNVYQKDMQKIKIGQKAEIYFDKINNSIGGKIFYISPIVDEKTRTTTARVKLENQNGFWKPGMFIAAQVLTDVQKVEYAVAVKAIQNFESQKVIFIQEVDGFVPRPVTIGRSNADYVEIVSGVSGGENYIAQGAFVIKSELLKESFGGGHGH